MNHSRSWIDSVLAFQKPVLLGCVVVLVFVFLFLLFLPSGDVEKLSAEKVWPASVMPVSLQRHAPSVVLHGQVSSLYEAQLVSSTEADVLAVLVRSGDVVARGQKLLLLDEEQLALQLAEKRASVAELTAAIAIEKREFQQARRNLKQEQEVLVLRERELGRFETLFEQKFAAKARVDEAKRLLAQQRIALASQQATVDNHPFRLQQLEAQLSRADALAQLVEIDLQRSQLVAPFEARVVAVHVAPGERVKKGDVLVELYDLSDLEVRTQVPDRYLSALQQALASKQAVSAFLSFGEHRFPMSLSRLGGDIARGQGGQEAVFVFDEPLADDVLSTLVLGRTVSLQLSLPAVENVVALPWSAVFGFGRIYEVVDDRLHSVAVDVVGETLREDDSRWAIVSSVDLKSGMFVLTTQLPNAINGLKVSVVE